VIVAASAFTHSGLLKWRLALLACLVEAVIADNCEFLLGCFAQPWLKQRYDHKPAWQQAQPTINRQGGLAIFLTRFWLMPLAPAINVIAGSRYPYGRFLFFDLAGQFIWVLLYGGLGYLFATQSEPVSQGISLFSGLSAEIRKFLQAYSADPVDLIIGKRSFNRMPLVRRLANNTGKWLFSWAVGQTIPDNQSGYRMLGRGFTERLLDSAESGFEFEVEMLTICMKYQFTLRWIPIRTIYSGQASHIQPWKHFINFLMITWVTRQRMRAHQVIWW
jgi:hypothetical protein